MSHIRRAGLLQIEHWEMQTRSGSGRTGLGSQLPQPSELVPGGFATHIVRLGEPLHWQPSTCSLHALLIFNGWTEWTLSRFFGYEFVPQLGRIARMEPGFGLANILGVVALFVALLLAATSSDQAMRALRAPGWKFLHNGAYFVFYVGSIHALYFLFIHFTFSFHKRIPEPDWFRYWFLAMVGTVVVLHISSFVKTVQKSRSKAADRA